MNQPLPSELTEIAKTYSFAPADGGGAAKLHAECHPKAALWIQIEEGGKIARLSCGHCGRFAAGLGLSGEIYSTYSAPLQRSPGSEKRDPVYESVGGVTVDLRDAVGDDAYADLIGKTSAYSGVPEIKVDLKKVGDA